MKPKILYFLPAVTWFVVTFFLMVIPGKDIPKAGFFDLIHFDKWVHFGMFGILVVLFSLPFIKTTVNNIRVFFYITILAIVYGILMEFVQKFFTKDRNFDITDIMADTAGALAGWWFIKWQWNKMQQKNKPL